MNPSCIPRPTRWTAALGILLQFAVGAHAALALTVTGTVYTDEGVTNIGANQTVAFDINGARCNTAETNASGVYSFTETECAPPLAGDVFTLYLDDESRRAVTVTISDGDDDTGIDLWVNRLILRHQNSGPVTNGTLDTADDSGDQDIITEFIKSASADASSIGTGELLIWTGATFRPGGTVTTLSGIDINGTFTMVNYNVTSSGSFDAGDDGVFTGTNTVLLSAKTGTYSVITNGSSFYNLTFGDSGGSASWRLGSNIDINGNLSISGGKLNVTSSNYQMNLSGNFLISSGSFIPSSGMVILDGFSQTLSGAILFSGLSKKNMSGATLSFREDRQVTVEDYLTLRGKEDRQMKIGRSGSSAAGFLRLINTGATMDLMFLDVTQNNARGGVLLNCRSGCINSGSNTNWSFTTRTIGEGGSFGQVILPGF